jgi:hypothetical protein
LLTHYDFVRRIAVASSEDWVLVFQDPEGHLTVVVWTTGENHNVLIPLAPGVYKVRSYLGQNLPALTAGPEGLTIQLTDAPRYLTRKDGVSLHHDRTPETE